MADDKKQNPTSEGRKPDTPAPVTPGGPPAPEKTEQAMILGMDGSAPASGKVINLSDVQAGEDKDKAAGPDKAGPSVPEADKHVEKPSLEKAAAQADKPGRGRPPKAEKGAEDKQDGDGLTPAQRGAKKRKENRQRVEDF